MPDFFSEIKLTETLVCVPQDTLLIGLLAYILALSILWVIMLFITTFRD